MAQVRSILILSFLAFMGAGCSPEALNSGDSVSFKTYDSITSEAGGDPRSQGDQGLAGPTNTGDGGGAVTENNPDGGGTIYMPVGGGTMVPGMNPVIMPIKEPDMGTNPGGSKAPETQTLTRSVEDNLITQVAIKKMCQAGEIDMIRILLECQPDSNLILTMKDGVGEALLQDFGSVSTQGGVESIIESVKKAEIRGKMAGSVVDLFVCIDHDGDKSCTDEEVTDLNKYNADLLFAVLKITDGDNQRKKVVKELCVEDRIGGIKNGLVLYHQQFVDRTKNDISASGANALDMVADEMARFVKNITEDTDVENFSVGTAFNLSLVESDQKACKDMSVRMHGCFVAGTRIKMSEKVELPIEKFRVGDPVLLSDGRTSKISKIVSGPEKKPIVNIELSSGEKLQVTDTHPMLSESGVIQAKDLSIGSRLLTSKGQWVTLQSLTTEKYDGLVYNFELAGDHEKDHLIYGNGIVTGDLYLQQKLQSKSIPGVIFSILEY